MTLSIAKAFTPRAIYFLSSSIEEFLNIPKKFIFYNSFFLK